MRKRLPCLCLCTTLLVCCFTACGSETPTNSTTTTTTTADTTVTTTVTTKYTGTTMTFAKGTKVTTTTSQPQSTKTTKPKPTVVNGKPVPKPAYDEGCTDLVFWDEFDSLSTFDFAGQSLPNKNWYVDSPYNPSMVTTRDYSVTNGLLTIKPVTTTKVGFTSYSKQNKSGYTWHYGYAEARMRFPVKNIPTLKEGRTTWPSFWGVSVIDYQNKKWVASDLGPGYTESGELDMFEAWQIGSGDIVFSGALHHHVRVPGSSNKNGTNANAMGNYKGKYVLDEGWHTYAALWREGYVAWYMDGEFMHSVEFGDGKLPVLRTRDKEGTTTPIASATNWEGVFKVLNQEDLVIVLGGGDKLWPLDIDWVRIWEYAD